MYVFRHTLGRRCLKRDERPLESAEEGTCGMGPCLDFALRDGLDDPSELVRRHTDDRPMSFGGSGLSKRYCGLGDGRHFAGGPI